jgi:hypothetical protein
LAAYIINVYLLYDYISMFTNKYEMLRKFKLFNLAEHHEHVFNNEFNNPAYKMTLDCIYIFSLLWHFYNFKYLPMQTLINIVSCMCIWKSNLITTKPEGMITTCTIEHTFSMYTITRRYKRSIKTKVSEVTTNLMNNI